MASALEVIKDDAGVADQCRRYHDGVDVLDLTKRYDVIRPLSDGERYVVLGSNLSAADAADLRDFHRPMDRKYQGFVSIRKHRSGKAVHS